MPVKCGKRDSRGSYCQWGSQKKYYYNPNDKASKERARKKAEKQGQAARAGGYKGKSAENDEKVTKNVEKEAECADCEPKLDEIDEKTIKSAENLQEMAQNDIKTEENEQKVTEIAENMDNSTLKVGNIVKYKGKIGKIIGILD